MSERTKIQIFVALLVVAAVAYFYSRNSESPALPSVLSANTRFEPLNVKEPALRLDLLRQLQNDDYKGAHRNIFTAAPPPPPTGTARSDAPKPFVGPQVPPPPPALQVPVEFYGVESSQNGKPVAFFKNGDDVLIVAEGDTFLNRFRLVHIGNQSAEIEETATGRRAAVPLIVQADQASGSAPN